MSQGEANAPPPNNTLESPEPSPKQVRTTPPPASLPLHSPWTLWFDNPKLMPPGGDWKDCLKNCGTFDTVQSFWQLFNNIKPAGDLSTNSNYSVFRTKVEPSWEDAANCHGGKFVLTIPKKGKDNKYSGRVDEWWLFTVLACVGETMDIGGNQVNGCVVSIRKHQDRIALWLKTSDKKLCIDIGERWKKALHLEGDKMTLRYQTHRDAAASGRSFRNEVQFEV